MEQAQPRRGPPAAALGCALLLAGASASAADLAPVKDLDLTLDEAVQFGVTRNLRTLEERLRHQRQEKLRRGAWAPYSPTLTFDTGASRNAFSRETLLTWAGGLSWRSPWGTQVFAEGVVGHVPSGAEGTRGALVVGLSQPLLQGAWWTGAALPLEEAALLSQLQRASFIQALNALIVDVESAYWDLAVAEADVVIKTRSLDRARQQYEDTKENIRRGILAGVEIYVVEENVVFFDQQRIQAEDRLRRARRRVAELLTLDPEAQVTLGQALSPPTFEVPDRDQVLKVGLEASPRIHAQRYRHQLAEARRAWARNQALPALDLTASLTALGTDPRFGGVSPAPSEPIPDARVGLSFALPLDRGAESARVDAALLEEEREAVELEVVERDVTFQILNAHSDLATNLELHALASQQVKLAELKLQAETEKYKSGISTLADVVRFQRELDDALVRLQRVTREVYVARVRLLSHQGTLHLAAGVRVDG